MNFKDLKMRYEYRITIDENSRIFLLNTLPEGRLDSVYHGKDLTLEKGTFVFPATKIGREMFLNLTIRLGLSELPGEMPVFYPSSS